MNRKMNARTAGIAMTLGGAALWGICGSCGQFLFQYKEATSDWLVPLRLTIAGAVILLALAFRDRGKVLEIWREPWSRRDIVLFAVSRTIGDFRDLNAHFLDDKMRYFNHVNLGIAVDTERGLLVPTLPHAEELSLNALSTQAKVLITEAQSGKISPDKLSGASFTVTNLGSMGVESFTPVVNPPQVGILGVCTITRRIKITAAGDVSYPAMGLSLTFDHRAIDGAPAAKFLQALCKNLEHFDLLLAK